MDENISQGSPEQLPEEHKNQVSMSRGLLYFLIASIFVLFVGLFVVMFLLFFKADNSKIPSNITNLEQNNNSNILENNAEILSKYDEKSGGKKDYSASLSSKDIIVDWYGGAKVLDDEQKVLVKKLESRIVLPITDQGNEIDYSDRDLDSLKKVYGYVVGEIKSPSVLAGRPLYLLAQKFFGMGQGYEDNFAFYDENIGDFVFVITADQGNCEYTAICQNFVIDDLYSKLEPKSVLDIPGEDSKLVFSSFLRDPESGAFNELGFYSNRGGVLNVEKNEFSSIPEDAPVFVKDKDMGSLHKVGSEYEVAMPDGAVAKYDYLPYFFDQSIVETMKSFFSVQSKLDVSWLRGSDNQDEFAPAGDFWMACGEQINTFPNAVNQKDWFSEDNLEVVGTTSKGDKIYTLTNVENNEYYKKLFNWGYNGYLASEGKDVGSMTEEQKWQDFVSDMPMVFWKNPQGDWLAFRKVKYSSMAECGKPVIYLYPEEETDVHVQVAPKAGLSISDPDYGKDGWFVRSTPDSEIFNYKNETEYPYLFWEGYSYDYTRPCYGFVMSKEDVPSRMFEILTKLGMNEKEIQDFMEFWEEKLTVKPYVFVTFLPQATFEDMAPLTVEPKPDTVIRVFMDYQALDYPLYNIPEPYLITPERKGFTVVEWGGRLN
ncbi:MAG: hypothetical protein COX80_01655 [Candidatus Magasanikbacteria bacterium CG_4_10_14_0_2_um_filter_33_14]|uniref:Uncharacterized protein n=1 Tax=Candidatus Magasanikbacteria bacterium CG_4_10_14_0_2_um_filter_33_14 TaxID=1974636 RepID=A0A2M7VB91_9BACT|nr:MAG: hypothetical protein COX80_01655 [Candidatus Magasanikbacteria bacterium CG_4_10_14_0_2_um_filter_33_14]